MALHKTLFLLLAVCSLFFWGCTASRNGVPANHTDTLRTNRITLYDRQPAAFDNASIDITDAADTENMASPDAVTEQGAVKKKPARRDGYTDYQFQAGDKIEISVWGEPDMTREVVVLPDGTVSYFLIGEIQAVGKTFSELRKELEGRLAKYILQPKVTIIGKTFTGTFVTVLGAVSKPGQHAVSQTDRVLDVIAKAKGFKYLNTDDISFAGDIASLKLAYLSRKGRLVDVDFDALIKDGDMSQNIQIETGDFIYIPSSTTQLIFVLGEVQHPRAVPFRGRTTLLEALTSAGGLDEITACKSSVCIVRGSLTKPEVTRIDVRKIYSGETNNLQLYAGDIVYVPSTFLTNVERISRKIIPFLDVIIKGDEVRQLLKGRKDLIYSDQ